MYKYEGKYFTLVCGFVDSWSYYFYSDYPFTDEQKDYILKCSRFDYNDLIYEYVKNIDDSAFLN